MGRTRVLLADDHVPLLERVTALLEGEYDVVGTAVDGQTALDSVAELEPDVLILDISMPVLNGIQVANQLGDSGSETKIVFLTVHEDKDFARAALATGALGYVIKPRIASDLVAAIDEALAGRSFVSPSIAVDANNKGA